MQASHPIGIHPKSGFAKEGRGGGGGSASSGKRHELPPCKVNTNEHMQLKDERSPTLTNDVIDVFYI